MTDAMLFVVAVVIFVVAVRRLLRVRAAEKSEATVEVEYAKRKSVSKTYPVGLVGEQHYQAAIKRLREGAEVEIVHEPDNPYDDQALAVRTIADETIGYIPKGSFVRDIVHGQGSGCRATVLGVEKDERGKSFLHVTISAEKCVEPVEQRAYKAAR